jgi:YidC/Oxa1 family membrane protein insertase
VFKLIADALAWFYQLWPSYGMSIVLLTVAVMVLLTPLTLKGTRSMMAMQRLQPELKKIQQKHKGDRQKLNEEMMAFYKENKINPLGGCLPLLLQMPVFIVLYRVIHGLTKVGSDGTFNPAYLNHDSDLYKALDHAKEMVSWGIDLSESAAKALSDSAVHAIPYFLLIGLVAATGWYQQRQMMARQASMGKPADSAQAQQQAIMRYMWLILPVISFSIPAGVVVYFLISNLYRVAQQAYIQATSFRDDTGGGSGDRPERQPQPVPDNPKGANKGGGAPQQQRPRRKKKKR